MAQDVDRYVATFDALVDVLLPGDDVFPMACETGVQHWLLSKLLEIRGEEAVDLIVSELNRSHQQFAHLSAEGKVDVVHRLQIEQPDLFDFILRTTYFGYYQSPLVVKAIRKLGHVYNHAPLPLGYEIEAFNPAKNLPTQPRGFYKQTNDVQPVDITGIQIEAESGSSNDQT